MKCTKCGTAMEEYRKVTPDGQLIRATWMCPTCLHRVSDDRPNPDRPEMPKPEPAQENKRPYMGKPYTVKGNGQ